MKKSLILFMPLLFLTSCVGTLTNNIQADARINATAQVDSRIDSKIDSKVSSDIKTGDISNNQNKTRQVASITVNPNDITVNVNDIIDLVGTVKFTDNTSVSNISWISSDTSIIKVDSNGKLTAINPGNAIVTAISKDDSSKITNVKVTVKYNVYTTPTPDSIPSYYPTPTPTESYGYDEVKERATFNGKVYDSNNVPIEGAKVSAVSIDPGVNWVGEDQVTIGGAYVFRNAPVGSRISITTSKDGWTSRDQVVVTKSNLQGDPNANVFDFRGTLAIQDEPEIMSIKINGRQMPSITVADYYNTNTNAPTVNKYENPASILQSNYSPTLTGIPANTPEIEFNFSEPVRRNDVEAYFKLQSQLFYSSGNISDSLIINKENHNISFNWSNDDKTVLISLSPSLYANHEGAEFRYGIEFTQAFRDKTDKPAKSRRYFRLSPSQINDFAIFSVSNQ